MKYLLFDFDGVLLDSFEDAFAVNDELHGGGMDKEVYRSFFNGNIYEETSVEETMKSYEGDESLDENDPFFVRYIPRILARKPVDGMVEMIQQLSEDGYKMSVNSSTITGPIEAWLKKYELAKYFDRVYGGDVDTDKTKKIKMAMEEFNFTADEALFITDTLGDLREAEHAGVKSIGVTWGYQHRENLEQGTSIAIVDSVDDLQTTINQHFSYGKKEN